MMEKHIITTNLKNKMDLQKEYYRKKNRVLKREKNPTQKQNKLFNIWIEYINEHTKHREKFSLKYCSEKININH